MPKIRTALIALAALALVLAAGAGATTKDSTLDLVAYSTPKPPLAKIISNWQQTGQGEGVDFTQSYGASTSQAKAVIAGQPADLVFFSTGDDVNQLVDAGLVDQNWDKQGYNGIAADTVVVFAVRDGNPKHIKGWNDLIKPGVQVVTPNPAPARRSGTSSRRTWPSGTSARPTPRQRRTCRSCSITSSRRTRRARTRPTPSSAARATC